MSVLIPISTTVVIMPTALTLLGATNVLALRATLEMDLCAKTLTNVPIQLNILAITMLIATILLEALSVSVWLGTLVMA